MKRTRRVLKELPHRAIRKSIEGFNTQKARLETKRSQEKEHIEKALMNIAPIDIRGTLKYAGVHRMLAYRGDTGLRVQVGKNFCSDTFKDVASIRRRFGRLRKAWKGQVVVKFEKTDDENVIHIFFRMT